MSFRYVASGFRQDVETLFSLFLSQEKESTEMTPTDGTPIEETPKTMSLRFSRFSECWRQMKFSLVFRHRFHENDLREFIEETFLVVLPTLGSEYPFERRVFALYLLYSLFAKQPLTVPQKIRINFSYLQQIRELIQKCKELEQLDVVFIWYKLLSLGAIDLVQVSRNLGPYFIRNYRATSGTETSSDFLINQFKASVYQPFNDLSQIHEKYQTIKQEVLKDDPNLGQEDNSVLENIFEKHKEMLTQLIKSTTNETTESVDSSTVNGSKECERKKENIPSDIGAKRRQLKERAVNCVMNSMKSGTLQIERRYGPITQNEIQTENRKKAKGKRGRPKVAKLNALL